MNKLLALVALCLWSMGCGTAGAPKTVGEAGGQAGGGAGPPVERKPCPRCVKIFDGKSWAGWVNHPGWSITGDGAMQGQPGGERAVHTRADYGSFRLFVTSRMNPRNGDHLGILFWGPSPGEGVYKKNIQFQSPHGAMWDYYVNDDNIGETRIKRGERIDETWHLTEILADFDAGQMRAAVNGVEVTSYQSPAPDRRVRGPLGMQRHGKGVSEYREIWVEIDPAEPRLLSVGAPQQP